MRIRGVLSADTGGHLKVNCGFSFVDFTVVYAYMQAIGMVDDHVVDCFRYPEAHLDNRMKFAVTHSQSPRCSGFPVASRNPTSTSVGTLIGLVVDQCLRGLNSRPDGIRRRDIGYDQKNIASSYSFNHARLKPGRNKCSTISKNQALKSTNRSLAVERKWRWTCTGGASCVVGYAPVPSWWISAPTGAFVM